MGRGVEGGGSGGGVGGSGGGALPHNRLGVDVLLDAAGGVRQRDPGVMCAALKVQRAGEIMCGRWGVVEGVWLCVGGVVIHALREQSWPLVSTVPCLHYSGIPNLPGIVLYFVGDEAAKSDFYHSGVPP